MQQQMLWHDSLTDALRALVEGLADDKGRHGAKAVAARLWPAMDVSGAHRKLLHSLDPERSEKLGLDEIDTLIRWGREQDIHIIPHYLAAHHGYELTVRSVEDRREALQQQFIAAQHAMATMLKEMEALT